MILTACLAQFTLKTSETQY